MVTEAFLESALQALKEEILSELHVALPGIVRAYDPATRTADVQPALRRETADGEILTAPLLRRVPVYLPDPSRLIQPGEECLLIFADSSLDGWMAAGAPALPDPPRAHALSDAFAFVGFWSAPRAGAE